MEAFELMPRRTITLSQFNEEELAEVREAFKKLRHRRLETSEIV